MPNMPLNLHFILMIHVTMPPASRRKDRRYRREIGTLHAEVGSDVIAARNGGTVEG